LGNLTGGAVLVAIVYGFVFLREGKATAETVTSTPVAVTTTNGRLAQGKR
jgi:hypothetical protein